MLEILCISACSDIQQDIFVNLRHVEVLYLLPQVFWDTNQEINYNLVEKPNVGA